jgi:CheY-like chemotaxis protein
MADLVLGHPVKRSALLDGIATLLGETLRERADRKSDYIAALRWTPCDWSTALTVTAAPTSNSVMLMKPKILVVDDDHSVRASLTKLLEADHYVVYAARDAIEAMECFNSQSIDLVVLDINLGVDNGWQVFEAMTAKDPFVPTIVITAEWGQRDQAVTFGVEGLIEKPIDVPAFLKMIRELLAETADAKLKRICGNDAYCRIIGRHYGPYLRMLQKRYAAPFRITSHDMIPADDESDVDTGVPEMVPGCAVVQGWRTGSDCTTISSSPPEHLRSTHEEDSVKPES